MRNFKFALGLVAAAAASLAQASTYPEFTVDPSPFFQVYNSGGMQVGTSGTTFRANQMAGNYNEIVSFGLGTFDVKLRFDITSFNLVNGSATDPIAASDSGLLSTTTLGGFTAKGYNLYALLSGSGTIGVGNVLNLTSGSFKIFVDDNRDTAAGGLPTAASGAFAINQGTADIEVANGVLISGQGTPVACSGSGAVQNCGSFGQTTTFALTPVGSTFFTQPTNPFYNVSLQTGNLNEQINTSVGDRGFNGQINMTFLDNKVPEPASLALVGLALAGLGLARRRRG